MAHSLALHSFETLPFYKIYNRAITDSLPVSLTCHVVRHDVDPVERPRQHIHLVVLLDDALPAADRSSEQQPCVVRSHGAVHGRAHLAEQRGELRALRRSGGELPVEVDAIKAVPEGGGEGERRGRRRRRRRRKRRRRRREESEGRRESERQVVRGIVLQSSIVH